MPPLFWWLLLGHLISDFPLQTGKVFRVKLSRPWGVALHGSICGAIGFVMAIPYLCHPMAWLYLALLWGFHILLDKVKLFSVSKCERGSVPFFTIDQALHVGSFWLVASALQSICPFWKGWYLRPEALQGVQTISAYLATTYGVLFAISSFWQTLGLKPSPPSPAWKGFQFLERICITTGTAAGGIAYLLIPIGLLPRGLILLRRMDRSRLLDMILSLIFAVLVGIALKPVFPGR